jgi:hypothetical protein
VPAVDADDVDRVLAFEPQLDVQPVRLGHRTDDADGPLTPEQVAGYLAKYATKSADDTGPGDSPHRRRIFATIDNLSRRALLASIDSDSDPGSQYERIAKWSHVLGFRGHFASRSHRYAITLTALRRTPPRASILLAQTR